MAFAANAMPALIAYLDTSVRYVWVNGLPGMDGYAVAARLRAEGHAATVLVALTGYGREDDVRRSRDAGFDHHLIKPIDFAQLRPIVVEVSGRRS